MDRMHYVRLDIHKKMISYCVKRQDGEVVREGFVPATRKDFTRWVQGMRKPRAAVMEETLFTGWIYDFLKPHADSLKVAHPQMLKAIAANKKKNDRVDAGKIADLLRCNLLPECYMAPGGIRELRRVLRYRNLVVRQSVLMKNKISGLLMEVGAEHTKSKLHGKKYFAQLLYMASLIMQGVFRLAGFQPAPPCPRLQPVGLGTTYCFERASAAISRRGMIGPFRFWRLVGPFSLCQNRAN